MLAYARNASFPALRQTYRRMGKAWRLPQILAMTPDAANALLGRVAQGRDRAAFASLFGHFAPR